MINYTEFDTTLIDSHMAQEIHGNSKSFEFSTRGHLSIGDRLPIAHPSDEEPIVGYVIGIEGTRLPMTLLVATHAGIGTVRFDGRWGELTLEEETFWVDCNETTTQYNRFLQCPLGVLVEAFRDNIDMFDADGELYEEVKDVLELDSLAPQIQGCQTQSFLNSLGEKEEEEPKTDWADLGPISPPDEWAKPEHSQPPQQHPQQPYHHPQPEYGQYPGQPPQQHPQQPYHQPFPPQPQSPNQPGQPFQPQPPMGGFQQGEMATTGALNPQYKSGLGHPPQRYNPQTGQPIPQYGPTSGYGQPQPQPAAGNPYGLPESPMHHQPWSNPYQQQKKTYQELYQEITGNMQEGYQHPQQPAQPCPQSPSNFDPKYTYVSAEQGTQKHNEGNTLKNPKDSES